MFSQSHETVILWIDPGLEVKLDFDLLWILSKRVWVDSLLQ